MMKTPYHTYMEDVFWVAKMYTADPSFTYSAATVACGDIARDFERQREQVMKDFEFACSELIDLCADERNRLVQS